MKKLLSFFVALLLCTDFISGQSAKSDSLFHVGVKQYCDQKYELAIKTFEMIEKIDVKDFGTDYYRLFYAKWWKASSYYNLGDTVSAKSISDYYDIEPIDRSITGLSDSLRYLAQFYYDSNDYINAITCMEKCLAIEEQEFINTFFPLSTINKLLSFFINEKNNLQDSVILSLFERGHKLLKPLIHNKGKIEIQTRYDFYLLNASYIYKKQINNGREFIQFYKQDSLCYKEYKNTSKYEDLLFYCLVNSLNVNVEEDDIYYIEEMLNLQSSLYGKLSSRLIPFELKKISYYYLTKKRSKLIIAVQEYLSIINSLDVNDKELLPFLHTVSVVCGILDQIGLPDISKEYFDYYFKYFDIDSANPNMLYFRAKFYIEQKEYNNALKYYNKALNYYNLQNNKYIYVDILKSIAICYDELNEDSKTLKIYDDLIKIAFEQKKIDSDLYYEILLDIYSKLLEHPNYREEVYQWVLAEDSNFHNSVDNKYYKLFESIKIISSIINGDASDLDKFVSILSNIFEGSLIRSLFSLNMQNNSILKLSNKVNYLLPLMALKHNNNYLPLNASVYDFRLMLSGYMLNSEQQLRKFIVNTKDSVLIQQYHDYLFNYSLLNSRINENSIEKDSLMIVVQSQEHALIENCSKHGNYYKDFNIRWNDVKNCLSSDEVLIDFMNYNHPELGNIYTALILCSDYKYPISLYVCNQKDLDELYFDGNINYSKIPDVIWKPILQKINIPKVLYFTPSGNLNKLPVESFFINGETKLFRISSGRELVKKTNSCIIRKAAVYGGLNYTAEIELLAEDAQKYNKDRSLVRDFKVDYRDIRESANSIPFLEGTKTEAEQIVHLFMTDKQNEVKLYSYNEGTEASFKSLSGSGIQMIHVGTHGFYDNYTNYNNNDLLEYENENLSLTRSGLLLTGAQNAIDGNTINSDLDDGILNALEISTLDLSTVELVTLSACQSALGTIAEDGVYGLQRGFKKAGAKSLVMSLWKVDDQATEVLMKEFYLQLLQGHSKNESLEMAKIRVRTDINHPEWVNPYYWASFILLDGIN